MFVICGKGAERTDLSDICLSLSISTSRGQFARTVSLELKNPIIDINGGFIMLYSDSFKPVNRFFIGTIEEYQRDEKTGNVTITSYESSHAILINYIARKKVNGDAGAILKSTINSLVGKAVISVPELGFNYKDERISPQSLGDFFSSVLKEAHEKTGIRYYAKSNGNIVEVKQERSNPTVLQFTQFESASTGFSLEGVYTSVIVQKYDGDTFQSAVEKKNAELETAIGTRQKVVEIGKDDNAQTVATRELAEVGKRRVTRDCVAVVDDSVFLAPRIIAGEKVQTLEKNGQIFDWTLISATISWNLYEQNSRKGRYRIQMKLEQK